MSTFFEKLKKGMDVEKPIEPVASVEPVKPTEPIEPVQLSNSRPEADLAISPNIKQEPVPKKRKKRTARKKPAGDPASVPSNGTLAGEAKIKVEKMPPMKKKVINDESLSLDSENDDWLDKEKIGQLTVDLYQTDKEIIIQSAIAGVEPEDLDITIEDDLVIIKGKREKKITQEKKDYFYQECHWGQFYREIILPVEADSSRATASMEQGVLTIKIPKTGTETKKKIEIK